MRTFEKWKQTKKAKWKERHVIRILKIELARITWTEIFLVESSQRTYILITTRVPFRLRLLNQFRLQISLVSVLRERLSFCLTCRAFDGLDDRFISDTWRGGIYLKSNYILRSSLLMSAFDRLLDFFSTN